MLRQESAQKVDPGGEENGSYVPPHPPPITKGFHVSAQGVVEHIIIIILKERLFLARGWLKWIDEGVGFTELWFQKGAGV